MLWTNNHGAHRLRLWRAACDDKYLEPNSMHVYDVMMILLDRMQNMSAWNAYQFVVVQINATKLPKRDC
jgi:hypothetical protein